ncbi:MAG: alanine dehydrogenase [Gammaproteobacteria bacterium]
MHIGIPKEIKVHEYRVGLTPEAVKELSNQGHAVHVQTQAGNQAGFKDESYRAAGAKILPDAAAVFEESELIFKVKEPQAQEYPLLRPKHTLFCFLHLAADLPQTEALLKSECMAIAFETVTHPQGGLPILAPMSEIAGRLSVQKAAFYLEKINGGPGMLMGGIAGVSPAKILVMGGGVAGTQAIAVALGMGAQVIVFDKSLDRLKWLQNQFGAGLITKYATQAAIEEELPQADVVIGAVLIPGASAPKLITAEMASLLKPGCVLVDIAIDQGGCFAASRPTTHADPVYVENNSTYYCVTNMPGAIPKTSTQALSNACLPYVLNLAKHGGPKACQMDSNLLKGLNVWKGQVTHEAVAEALRQPYTNPSTLISA